MDRVSLLYIRSRPVLDFHWLESAACSRGVNELAIQLHKCNGNRTGFCAIVYSSTTQGEVNLNLGFTYRTLQLQKTACRAQLERQDLIALFAADRCSGGILFLS